MNNEEFEKNNRDYSCKMGMFNYSIKPSTIINISSIEDIKPIKIHNEELYISFFPLKDEDQKENQKDKNDKYKEVQEIVNPIKKDSWEIINHLSKFLKETNKDISRWFEDITYNFTNDKNFMSLKNSLIKEKLFLELQEMIKFCDLARDRLLLFPLKIKEIKNKKLLNNALLNNLFLYFKTIKTLLSEKIQQFDKQKIILNKKKSFIR